jgi:uncharacterized protein YndB with AHSA1/START domain
MSRQLTIKAALKMLKPPQEVFEAIVDPSIMSNYFISESSGSMEEGKEVTWKFPEMHIRFPVQVTKVVKDRFIGYTWGDDKQGFTKVEIQLKPMNNSAETFVTVHEGTKTDDDKGIEWYGRNTEGWANFLACMKAWLEYGVHLRKGAFDISQMPEE